MTTVGILGGGQLARMLALSGAPLGLRFLVMDAAPDACASQFVPQLTADYRDEAALAQFASQVQVATFDFENVPAESAQWLAERIPVHPAPRALAVAQDRLAEKSLFNQLGIGTPKFAAVEDWPGLLAAMQDVGVPSILKTRRLGYDGKGQFRLRSRDDAEAAWSALGGQAPVTGLILEAFVPFERELSVLAVRSRQGEFRTWPITENWHREGVLAASLAPAHLPPAIAAAAASMAKTVAESLEYVGVFALELFLRDGRLLANEMAPRVHNSGHWTIEGAATSQFQNHLRAVLGLALGDTGAVGIAAMLNWIGDLPSAGPVLRQPRGYWHDYGKLPRPGRKVGHATLVAESSAQLVGALQRVGQELGRDEQVGPIIAALQATG